MILRRTFALHRVGQRRSACDLFSSHLIQPVTDLDEWGRVIALGAKKPLGAALQEQRGAATPSRAPRLLVPTQALCLQGPGAN